MNRPHVLFLLLFTFGPGCASEEPKGPVEDMNLDADIENDVGVSDLSDLNLPDVPDASPINCHELAFEECVQFFGECQVVRLYEWYAEEQCYNGTLQDRGLCLPADQVGDELHQSIIDPEGRCWGMLPALVEEPPGWTQYYLIPCSCIKGDQVIEDCTDSWDFCPE